MTTEIAKSESNGLPIKSMGEIAKAGDLLAQANYLGTSNPGEGFMVMATCQQTGMSLIEFQSKYHLRQGRFSIQAHALLAEYEQRGGKYTVIERSPERAAVEFEKNGNKYLSEVKWSDAIEEPFVYKGNEAEQLAQLEKPIEKRVFKNKYRTPRSRMQMLWARAISDGVVVVDPGARGGIYTPEETDDFMDSATAPKKEVVIDPEKANKALKPKEAAKPAKTPKDDVVDVKATEVKEETKPADSSQGKKLFDAAKDKAAENEKADFTVCPIAANQKFYNVPWVEFGELKYLESCFNAKDRYPEMTAGHIAELEKEIARRKTEKAGA